MPILAAISGIGRRRARRAIWRSVGNVTAMATLLSSRQQSRQGGLTPALGWLYLVEREHVQTRHLALRRCKVRQQACREAPGVMASRPEHSQKPVGVAAEEARRVDDTDSCGDAQELGGIGDARKPDVDRKLNAATPHPSHPLPH